VISSALGFSMDLGVRGETVFAPGMFTGRFWSGSRDRRRCGEGVKRPGWLLLDDAM
jgi:hypothetical protein